MAWDTTSIKQTNFSITSTSVNALGIHSPYSGTTTANTPIADDGGSQTR